MEESTIYAEDGIAQAVGGSAAPSGDVN